MESDTFKATDCLIISQVQYEKLREATEFNEDEFPDLNLKETDM